MAHVQLRSGIFFEAYIYCRAPIEGGYTLSYRITYAGATTSWQEPSATSKHRTHEIKFEYALGCDSQLIEVHLVATPYNTTNGQ